jgi:transposase
MNEAQEYINTTTRNIRRKTNKLLGKVSLVKPILDKLGIKDIFEETLKDSPKRTKVSNGTVGEVMALNRLAAPMPMLNVEHWVDKYSCVGDVYKVEPGSMNDDRIADFLDDTNPHITGIWDNVVTKAIGEYDIPFDILNNDITSIYFEGAYNKSDMIEHGYSRDSKPDKKQINLGINSNSMGVPLAYYTLSGKTPDKSTVIDNMDTIMRVIKKSPKTKIRPLVVGDRVMQDNKIIVRYHQRGDMDYLGSLMITNDMKEKINAIPDEDYKIIETRRDYGLYKGYETEWEFEYQGTKAVSKVLIVKSEQKLISDRKQREKEIAKYTAALEDLKSKLNGKRYTKEEKVKGRIETFRKRHKGSKYVNVEVKVNEQNKLELSYTNNNELIAEEEKLDGKYVLVTSRKEMSAEEMVWKYKGRDVSEKDFSVIKGPLQIRPIFLHKDERIESLVLLTMIALLVYCILKMQIIEKEVGVSVNSVLEKFKWIGVIHYEFMDGSKARIASDLDNMQEYILGKLGFPNPSEYVNFAT